MCDHTFRRYDIRLSPFQDNSQSHIEAYYLDLAIPEATSSIRARRIQGLSILVHSRYVNSEGHANSSFSQVDDRSLHSVDTPGRFGDNTNEEMGPEQISDNPIHLHSGKKIGRAHV